MVWVTSTKPEAVGRSAAGKVCPSVSVSLSDVDRTMEWELLITVRRDEGGLCELGRVVTLPQGDKGARIVALAYCPGALEWNVQARPITIPAAGAAAVVRADISLAVDECCGGGVGVSPVPGNSAIVETPQWIFLDSYQLTSPNGTSQDYNPFVLSLASKPGAKTAEFLVQYTPTDTNPAANASCIVLFSDGLADGHNDIMFWGGQITGGFGPTGFMVYPAPFPQLPGPGGPDPFVALRLSIPVPPGARELVCWLIDQTTTTPGFGSVRAALL